MKKYDLKESAYGWYVVAHTEDGLNGQVTWDMVTDERPGEKFESMTDYEKAMHDIYGDEEDEPEFYREATYGDLVEAVEDAPGWDFGRVVEMLDALCGWTGVNPEDYPEDFQDVYDEVMNRI